MSYVRTIQSGNVYEVYEYKRDYVPKNKRDYLQNTRRASIPRERDFVTRSRSSRSIKRAKNALIRLITANIQRETVPAFFTLTIERETPLEVGYSYLSEFWKHVFKQYGKCRYIGVPEWQSRGVLHFHFLVWGLPRESTDNKRERSTRNFQRHWYRGFCDVRNARYNSLGLAGYLAKYLTKALIDHRLGNRRAYTCSRNIQRPCSTGYNAAHGHVDELTPVEFDVDKVFEYETIYLGNCRYTKYVKNIDPIKQCKL